MAKSKCRWECPQDWSEWSEWLAAGLHARNRWRLPILLTGMLLASGRRTVTTWLRAAGVSDAYLFGIIALGGPAFGKDKLMKAFADRLDGQQISDLVAYLLSLRGLE